MDRFTQLPFTLYRMQGMGPYKLRDYQSQMKLGRNSFDIKLHLTP